MLRKIIFDLSIKYQTFLFYRQHADFDPWKLPAGIWSGRLLFLCLLLSMTLEWFSKVLTQQINLNVIQATFSFLLLNSLLWQFLITCTSAFYYKKLFTQRLLFLSLVRVLRWLTCLRWPAFSFLFFSLSSSNSKLCILTWLLFECEQNKTECFISHLMRRKQEKLTTSAML